MTGHGGKKYWTIVFSIEIHFGLTEFKARIKWTDDVCLYLLFYEMSSRLVSS